ncbi:MAG: alpha/beta fold hydrolase [Betaproteobacteria bacterium]|uniref:Alpha/beta fold hydrolase n=1 Tax=Candidatus Proximibacter danicus TaxID=2954365 RepID=A0A9D7K0S3_9PROT|nr:alpha/beta fold hydrolase [Candidatus Proximibacter danicus]
MVTAQSGLIALSLLGGGVAALNWGIRRSLAAPRLQGEEEPEGIPFRTVRIPTRNGKNLFAWMIPAGKRSPSLVLMHGWGGNSAAMLPLVGPLHAGGYTLLLVDARCHGRSDGDSFASLPRFAEDIEAALFWLSSQEEADPLRLGVIGHSVGAGAALLAASRYPGIKAVVSLAAFAHPATMMRRWMQWKRIPYWPLGRYILAYVQKVIGYRFDRIAPCRTIAAVDCPVLLVHGSEDRVVPLDDAKAIYGARRSDRVELLVVQGSHDDYGDLSQPITELLDFLKRNLAQVATLHERGASNGQTNVRPE